MAFNKQLADRFPYIVKWGFHLGSEGYYIQDQLELAHRTQAPANAVYRRDGESTATHGWITTDDITNDSARRQLGLGTWSHDILKLYDLTGLQVRLLDEKLSDWIDDDLRAQRSELLASTERAIAHCLGTHRAELVAYARLLHRA
jgi:hypothetical protein